MRAPPKSPARSAAVGTNPVRTVPRFSRFLVLDDRTAQRGAEVVPLQLILRLLRLFQKVIRRVELVAAARVEHVAAELVGTAARDDVDLRAAGLAELRPVAVAQDLELFDRFERGIDEDRAVRPDVVVVRAVDRPHVRGDVAPADGKVRSAEQPLVLDVEEIGRADAGHQRRELQEVASVERQLADLIARDQTGDVAANRLHVHGIGRDRHGLGNVAGRELEIDRAILGDVERDIGAHRGLEAGKRQVDAVRADRELREQVRAIGAGRGAAGQPRALLLGGDGHPRKHAFGGVPNGAAERGSRPLRQRGSSGSGEDSGQNDEHEELTRQP
jgi:hypothetical protein